MRTVMGVPLKIPGTAVTLSLIDFKMKSQFNKVEKRKMG